MLFWWRVLISSPRRKESQWYLWQVVVVVVVFEAGLPEIRVVTVLWTMLRDLERRDCRWDSMSPGIWC